jgi:Na+-translocating ferredoxin:NAD+ oxidoreductase RnfD subunit
MSAPAIAASGKPTVRIGGTAYPVLLPTIRDPRLHLAAVITTLQVLGQTVFDFQLSIAQILVSLLTCAVLEVAIALRRQRVLMWPASALLTGNGVAFVLRVPGTEHGDWWSLNGWWIFAGAAAVGLLSKYVITFRGRHVFNPSNFGLVLCFLLLGPERADPLPFWWGPMSVWLALALALIVVGGLAILSRLRLTGIAVGFWVTFAAGIAVLAWSGHEMTAAWHLGPITGWDLWWLLVTSPEILVFLFFMITDPRTIPTSDGGRRAYAVSVGFLAALLMAPWTTEFAHKVAVLGALALVCAARPPLLALAGSGRADRLDARLRGLTSGRARFGAAAAAAAIAVALLVVAGLPARPEAAVAAPADTARAPQVTTVASPGLAPIDEPTARRIAAELVVDLSSAAEALRTRDRERAGDGATGAWLADLWRRIDAARTAPIEVPTYEAERIGLRLARGKGQGPPRVLATLSGEIQTTTYARSGEAPVRRTAPQDVVRTFEVVLRGNRYLVTSVRGEPGSGTSTVAAAKASFRLTDVARSVGLDFRHGAFRFGVTGDEAAMMGGGLCWLDYDGDGWLDLYAVSSYTEEDVPRWSSRGGLPRSRLYRNVQGRFEDVTAATGAGLAVRGSGCVAADFDGDGATDLFVTVASYDVRRNAYDALLWNNGDGTFTEGAKAAGIDEPGWHTGAAAADVNGDGRLDLFVAGYTDMNHELPGSESGFPADHGAVRDLLYLNETRPGARPRFREVGRAAGLEPSRLDHGLGAVFTDVDRDGRSDLYVANDLDPNRLYLNRALPGGAGADPRGLGFRLRERGRAEHVDDTNAGMGVAAADYSGDQLADLFVTNSRGQLHAAYRSIAGQPFADARPQFAPALGDRFTGWGVTWADLDLDGSLELAIANGAIPVMSLTKDAERLQVVSTAGESVRPLDVGAVAPRNGRGLAAADYDNDGDLDLAVGSIGGALQLLRNDGASGRWLEVELASFVPGTRVTVVLGDGRELVREARAGGSYLSSDDPRLHFGLGEATRVREIMVRYPSGKATVLDGIAVDRRVVVPPPAR